MKAKGRAAALVQPVPGRSHWCEGRFNTCAQVVRNSSDHCEAGHKNKRVFDSLRMRNPGRYADKGFGAPSPASDDVDDLAPDPLAEEVGTKFSVGDKVRLRREIRESLWNPDIISVAEGMVGTLTARPLYGIEGFAAFEADGVSVNVWVKAEEIELA